MAQMVYSREDLMASHKYARPHEEVGYKLHGGFLENGEYTSPRVLNRWPAVKAWAAALQARGGTLIDCSRRILTGDTYPTREQQKLLLGNGFGQTFWNSLTNTGVIEARGGALCEVPVPDFQALFVEDVSQSCSALAVMAQGVVVFRGHPRTLIDQARGKVSSVLITDGRRPPVNLAVVAAQQQATGVQYRVLGDAAVMPGAVIVEPTLEDGYIWLMRRRAPDHE